MGWPWWHSLGYCDRMRGYGDCGQTGGRVRSPEEAPRRGRAEGREAPCSARLPEGGSEGWRRLKRRLRDRVHGILVNQESEGGTGLTQAESEAPVGIGALAGWWSREHIGAPMSWSGLKG